MSTSEHIPLDSGNLRSPPYADQRQYQQEQPNMSTEYDPYKPEKEQFPDALAAIAGNRPLQPQGTIPQSIANLNPVPIIKEKTNMVADSFAADSHDLAHSTEIEGALQTRNGQINGGIRDIGWHKPNVEIPDPLIEGMTNGHLFAMIRRFNKVRLPHNCTWSWSLMNTGCFRCPSCSSTCCQRPRPQRCME